MANRALLDWALERVHEVAGDVAVNVHHCREQMEAHLSGRVHLSIEEERPLGTAGALGALRDWLDGRDALIVNGDTWCPAPLGPFLDGWDGERVRVCVLGRQPLGPRSMVIASLAPWRVLARLPAVPLGLWEGVWRPGLDAGTVETVGWEGPFVDCATPADYLAANLAALRRADRDQLIGKSVELLGTAEESILGAGSRVEGSLVRTVVWPGATVARSERLVDAIRADRGVTVLVR